MTNIQALYIFAVLIAAFIFTVWVYCTHDARKLKAKNAVLDSSKISCVTRDILRFTDIVTLDKGRRIYAIDNVYAFDKLLKEYIESYLQPSGAYALDEYISKELEEKRAFFIILDGREYVAITPIKTIKSYGFI